MPRRTVYSVLGAFAVSRAAVIVLLVVGSQIAFIAKDYSTIWRTEVSLSAGRFWPELLRVAMVGDAWFYRSIAISGYEGKSHDGAPKNTWAFFPLYPFWFAPADGGCRLLVPHSPAVVVCCLHATVGSCAVELRLAAVARSLRVGRFPALLLAGRRLSNPGTRSRVDGHVRHGSGLADRTIHTASRFRPGIRGRGLTLVVCALSVSLPDVLAAAAWSLSRWSSRWCFQPRWSQ